MPQIYRFVIAVVLTLCSVVGYGAESVRLTEDPAIQQPKLALVVSDLKPSEVVDLLVQQSKEKILLESTAKTRVTLTLNDVELESALTAICKSGKFEWRKLYIRPDSKLLEQPDRLAATVRLVVGLGFPDLVIAGSSTGKVAVHSESENAIKAAEDSVVKKLGLIRVYLISNDAAVAVKAKEEEKSKAVEEYTSANKKLMDLFMNMAPEERERAIMEAINLMDQVGPGYMSSMMQTFADANPDMLKQVTLRQTQMLFGMDEVTRRKLMRLNMESMKYLTPEQLQILRDDQTAIMKDIQSEGGSQTP